MTDAGRTTPKPVDEIDAYFESADKNRYIGAKPKSTAAALALLLLTGSVGYRLYMGDWVTAGALVAVYFTSQHFLAVWVQSQEPLYLWLALAIASMGLTTVLYDLVRMRHNLKRHNDGVAAAEADSAAS